MVKNLPANAGDPGLIPAPEDPTCPGATKPTHHNYRSRRTLEPVLHNESHRRERPTDCNWGAPPTPSHVQLEKPAYNNKDPAQLNRKKTYTLGKCDCKKKSHLLRGPEIEPVQAEAASLGL